MDDFLDFYSEETENSESVDDDECEGLDLSQLFADLNITNSGFGLDPLDIPGFTTPPSNGNTSISISNNTTPGVFNDIFNGTSPGVGLDLSSILDGITPGTSNGSRPAFPFDLSALGNSNASGGYKDSNHKTATDLIWQVVPPIVIVLGSIGNLLTILVMFRQLRRSSTAVFLVALAISDIMILYCGPLREWVRQLKDLDVRNLSESGCKASVYFTYASLQLSSWLLVLVTLQRVIVVRWPYKRNLRCSPKAALIVICVLIVVIYGLNAHFVYGMGNSSLPSYVGRGKCFPLYGTYVNFHNKTWPWVDFAVVFALPFIILCGSNAIIIHQVKKQSILRRRMSIGSGQAGSVYEKDTRMITAMLILLSMVFLICTLPTTIYFILMPYYSKKLDRLLCKNDFAGYSKQHDLMTFWHAVTGCISYLNATLNFVLYVISGTRFRKELAATLCCRLHARSKSESLKSRLSRLSTVRSLSSSISQREESQRKKSRSVSVDASGIERLLSKMKLRKQSETSEKRRMSNRCSIDTTITDIDNDSGPSNQNDHHLDRPKLSRCETLPEKDDDGPYNQNHLYLNRPKLSRCETLPGDDNVEIAHNLCAKSEKKVEDIDINIDPLGDKLKGIMDTQNMAITQLCLSMVNKSKPDILLDNNNINNRRHIANSELGKRKFKICESLPEVDVTEHESCEINIDADMNGLNVDPLSDTVNVLINTHNGPILHPCFTRTNSLRIGGAFDNHDDSDDPTDDYVKAGMFHNEGFCTEYDLGVI